MKKLLAYVFFLAASIMVNAQTFERVEVSGRIIVQTNDVDGVTVFNTSSNMGTITNEKGEFKISVTLNDILEISALQFENFTVKIDEKILKNRFLTVYLVEKINKLDEVVITPYDMLTGNLITDVESVKTFNPDLDAIYFGVAEIYAFDFTDDYKSGVENEIMRQDQFYNGVNVIGVLGGLLKPIFNKKNKKEETDQEYLPSVYNKTKDITDVYGKQFIVNTFRIPESRVEAFVAFVNANNFDQDLLNDNNEVQLIEHLFAQSQKFLNSDNEKN